MAGVDLDSLSYMKLKAQLISMGIPKAEVDACPGKPTLLLLALKSTGAEIGEAAPRLKSTMLI